MFVSKRAYLLVCAQLHDALAAIKREREERLTVQAKLDRMTDQALGRAGAIVSPVMEEATAPAAGNNMVAAIMTAMNTTEIEGRR